MNGFSGAEIKAQLDHSTIMQSETYIQKLSPKSAKASAMRLDFGE